MIFQQGQSLKNGGLVDPNDNSPQGLARRRALLMQQQPQYGNAQNLGQGISQFATGIGTGWKRHQMNAIEQGGQASAQGYLAEMLRGGGMQQQPKKMMATPAQPPKPQGLFGFGGLSGLGGMFK